VGRIVLEIPGMTTILLFCGNILVQSLIFILFAKRKKLVIAIQIIYILSIFILSIVFSNMFFTAYSIWYSLFVMSHFFLKN